MSTRKQVVHRPDTVERARRIATSLDYIPDTAGRMRVPGHADAIREATRIGLAELERRFNIAPAPA